ncbi:TIR domain-containing protein [Arthrobacter sp. ERGS1:01]|uniref:TIR domain-containing protein n=1 Tax=Arthrobacter sp. ERGS1:01 TaxID=1704044 RepID=UPI0006B60666|nr:nucleotide-binding protein [Arthrobacter sp. ERGS1:01]
MDLSRKLELLQKQIDTANKNLVSGFEDWREGTEMVLRTVMGNGSPLHMKFTLTQFRPSSGAGGAFFERRQAGIDKALSILRAAQNELRIRAESQQAELTAEVEELIDVADKGTVETPGRIFIVHGHDDGKKHELARFLTALTGSEPVILHEQPNKGALLMEKLETSAAGTGFAVVLLTADDLGRAKTEEDLNGRGRQNVVFEMGFFMGALGRSHVAVLMDEGVEVPGDVTGLVYTSLDAAGAWKHTLAREIEHANIHVDWSALR